MEHYGDITKISGYDVPIVDIVTGGSPCQDLSVAGKRAGLDGERSGLFMEQIRIIKEMRENDRINGRTAKFIRPRYMVWENVAGAFSSNKGEDFRVVLEETAKIVDKDAVIPRLENGQKWTPSGCILGDGWSIAWRVHDAQFWGVPQRRKRVALVADFGGHTAPEILFERESVSRNTEPSGTQRQGTPTAAKNGVNKTGVTIRGQEITPTLISGQYKQCGNTQDGLTVVQGWEESTVNDTLNAFDNGEVRTPTLILENHPNDSRMKIQENNVFQTLSSRMGTGGNNTPMVMENVIVRRLTPLECERLQGFPDGWTNIGDWVDSKGKIHKGEADSPRYKALGNSIALPFWQWLADRMIPYIEGKPTMASLFDGIGGFPLVFSRAGCEPVWASEIEEFPIAVTKKRFNNEN